MFNNVVCTDGNYICQQGCAFIYCNCHNIVILTGIVIALIGAIILLYIYQKVKGKT